MSVRLSIVREFECTKESYISICGKWLAEAGFKNGSRFVIESTQKGEIVLKLVEEDV